MRTLLKTILAATMLLPFAGCSNSTAESASTGFTEPSGGDYQTEPGSSQDKTLIKDIDDIVAIDNENCSVTITKIENNYGDYSLKATLENKTADKSIDFYAERLTVNGVECMPWLSSTVSAGKKATEYISFDSEYLSENGIKDYTDIEVKLVATDHDNPFDGYLAEETVHVYPEGEEKATKYTREDKKSDTVLFDDENVKVVVDGYEEDEYLGFCVNVYFENKTDKDLVFCTDDASVNGYMISPSFVEHVGSGKCAFATISWFPDELKSNDIEKVEEIEFRLQAFDDAEWDEPFYIDDTVKLNPKY